MALIDGSQDTARWRHRHRIKDDLAVILCTYQKKKPERRKSPKYSVQEMKRDIYDELNKFRIFVGYMCVIITLFSFSSALWYLPPYRPALPRLNDHIFHLNPSFFFSIQQQSCSCLECIILHPVLLSSRGLSLTTVGETQLKQREEKNKINHTHAHFLPAMPRRLNLSWGVLMLGLRRKKRKKVTDTSNLHWDVIFIFSTQRSN